MLIKKESCVAKLSDDKKSVKESNVITKLSNVKDSNGSEDKKETKITEKSKKYSTSLFDNETNDDKILNVKTNSLLYMLRALSQIEAKNNNRNNNDNNDIIPVLNVTAESFLEEFALKYNNLNFYNIDSEEQTVNLSNQDTNVSNQNAIMIC